MRAIVFDFFGTLTDPAAENDRLATFAATASRLGVPVDRFVAAMTESFGRRATGVYGSTRDTLRAMAQACDADPSEERLTAAVATHHAGAETVRRPRPEAIRVLGQLRARGYRLGLLSDCSSELCEAWPDTPYAPMIDTPVFSWREGCRKPDPRLYAAVAARLDVAPAECWFVGDGGSREHDGARRAGMRPILVTNAAYPGVGELRTDPDTYVPDHQIPDLSALPALLGLPALSDHT
ncbi:putative HAD-hydrolase [Actinoplanes sp. SE50]|uniref:HAD family hydrolase n=1 Tax=unclassified Actinoplanes TaxID=2626549 RepID=UPI00023EDDBD|nr:MULTISPECIES: HAD family hydrolase [unclassified Actinoplanes]AEV88639.1 putative HAD-hydrolase [Actinoplanes sp. SE50/110]ATO87043.1 putative HAD-hydrolase [Actinoplanes sp. SE50]SLM04461.1 haloacid dehalogenase [Actinoplanes sp. SE50/110]